MSVRTLIRGSTYWIKYENAARANALTEKMYDQINCALDEANEHKETTFTVLTGEGNYYSSGNDFSPSEWDTKKASSKDVEIGFSRWVRRLIDHEKILLGLVNGPAMGMSATTLGLMDYLVCSDKTFFYLPFPVLGVCPEAGASHTLPSMLGMSRANGLMLFGERLEAAQALQCGFVGKVFPHDQFEKLSEEMVNGFEKLPRHSVLASKSLIKGSVWRQKMRGISESELDTLRMLFATEETQKRIGERFTKKK